MVHSAPGNSAFSEEIRPKCGMVSFLAVGMPVHQTGERLVLHNQVWQKSVHGICAVMGPPELPEAPSALPQEASAGIQESRGLAFNGSVPSNRSSTFADPIRSDAS